MENNTPTDQLAQSCMGRELSVVLLGIAIICAMIFLFVLILIIFDYVEKLTC